MKVALLAGGTGGAKLAAGMQELVGARPCRDREHGRRHAGSTGSTSLPTPTSSPTGSPGRSTRSAAGGSARTASSSTSDSSSSGHPGWFQLSDRDLATCLYRTHFMAEGGTLTAAQGQIARALGVCLEGPADGEEPVDDPGDDAGRLARPSGVPHRRCAPSPRSRAWRCRGSARRRPTPEVLEALAAAEVDRRRPLESGDLDRPDPRGPGDAGGDRRIGRSRRRGEPIRRRPGRQGADGEVHGGAGPAFDRRRRGVALRGGDPGDGRRRGRSRRGARGRPGLLVPDADGGTPRGGARSPSGCSSSRSAASACAGAVDAGHGDHPGEAVRRGKAAPARRPRSSAARRARQGDAGRRSRGRDRARGSRAGDRRDRRGARGAPRAGPRAAQ